MRIVYFILMVLAGIAFLMGVIIKLFMGGADLPQWMAPVTLWRGSMGCAALSLVFILLEIRDILVKKP